MAAKGRTTALVVKAGGQKKKKGKPLFFLHLAQQEKRLRPATTYDRVYDREYVRMRKRKEIFKGILSSNLILGDLAGRKSSAVRTGKIKAKKYCSLLHGPFHRWARGRELGGGSQKICLWEE